MKGDEHQILEGCGDKLKLNITVITFEEFAGEQNPSLSNNEAITDWLTVDIVVHL